MLAWNFIKHFPCKNLSRHILRDSRVRPLCFFTSSTPPSSFSIFASLSTSSSSSSSSSCFTDESFAAPYLSVRIHCPKHALVCVSLPLISFKDMRLRFDSLLVGFLLGSILGGTFVFWSKLCSCR